MFSLFEEDTYHTYPCTTRNTWHMLCSARFFLMICYFVVRVREKKKGCSVLFQRFIWFVYVDNNAVAVLLYIIITKHHHQTQKKNNKEKIKRTVLTS